MSKQKNIFTFGREYSGSTSNVIKSVLLGKADAGATFVTELEKEPIEIRDQIRTLLVTPQIAPHPLCAHPRIPAAAQAAVRRAVLAIAAEAKGAELLKTLRMGSPIPANYARDYESLEEVDVKGLSNWGK